MKNQKVKIAVIILNFNGKDNTLACLKSLSQVIVSNFILEILVVDNKSSDNSCKIIQTVMKEFSETIKTQKQISFTLIPNNENLGFCEGNNVGIRRALENKADFLFLLNNDTLVDKMVICDLLKTARIDKKSGIIGPKIYFAPRFEFHYKRYQDSQRGKVIWYAGGIIDRNNLIFSHRGVDEVDNGQFNKVESTDFVSGCAMFIRKEIFSKVKLFDIRYFLYLEDVDLCERTRKAGFEIMFQPKALVWHKNASSTGKPGSKMHVYYQTRNRLLFGFSFSSWRTKLALFRESVRMLFGENLVQKRAVWDFYTGNFEKADSLL